MITVLVDETIAMLLKLHPGAIEYLEMSAEGDDFLERLRWVHIRIISDFVAPRLLTFDRALVRLCMLVLSIWCAALIAVSFVLPLDYQVSRLFGAGVISAQDSGGLLVPGDGTALYEVLQYLLILTVCAVFVVLISAFGFLLLLLSSCSELMIDIDAQASAKLLSVYQSQHPEFAPFSRDRGKEGEVAGVGLGELRGPRRTLSSYKDVFDSGVVWLSCAETSDMAEWWAKLSKDIKHSSDNLTAQNFVFLSLLSIGASVLTTYVLVAFRFTNPLLQRLILGAGLLATIAFAFIGGNATSPARAYGLVVASESYMHFDACMGVHSALSPSATLWGRYCCTCLRSGKKEAVALRTYLGL